MQHSSFAKKCWGVIALALCLPVGSVLGIAMFRTAFRVLRGDPIDTYAYLLKGAPFILLFGIPFGLFISVMIHRYISSDAKH